MPIGQTCCHVHTDASGSHYLPAELYYTTLLGSCDFHLVPKQLPPKGYTKLQCGAIRCKC